MQRMMAWLGTALKSSQPRRRAAPQIRHPDGSDDGRRRGVGRGGTSGVALPGYGVAIVVSLIASGKFTAPNEARACLGRNDRDQARREDKETEPA